MELLVVSEKNGFRFFVPENTDTFLKPFIELVRERLEEGWYEDQFRDKAAELVERYDALMLAYEEPEENPIADLLGEEDELLRSVQSFLEKRRRYEYEDWEVVQTEN